jgi:glycyl-tRNA synthetase alpha subunit
MPSKLTLAQADQNVSPGTLPKTDVSNNQILQSSAESSVHSSEQPKRVRILCCANCKQETLEKEEQVQ